MYPFRTNHHCELSEGLRGTHKILRMYCRKHYGQPASAVFPGAETVTGAVHVCRVGRQVFQQDKNSVSAF